MMEFFRTTVSRFNALERSEKALAAIIAGMVAILFLYFAIWMPVNSYYQASLLDRDRQASLIRYMRASEDKVRASISGRPAGQSLITEVSSTAEQAGIKPNRFQPEGSDAVSVWFDNVSFDDLIAWIVQLDDQRGIRVRQITIDRQDTPGIVNARVILRS
ncbi:MAG: type II secretion system protein M [Gammaproteobacteria bacterium]|nr:type II secretion system protein M [Gammaproteobacteria bacterium]